MKKSHTGRNISVLALIVAIAVIAVALSGALSAPQAPTSFIVFVHAYDQKYGNLQTIEQLTANMLVANATVTVAGANQATRFTPTGIIAYDQLPAGTYQITVKSTGYASNTITYSVGPNCPSRTPDGQCHALVPLTKVS